MKLNISQPNHDLQQQPHLQQQQPQQHATGVYNEEATYHHHISDDQVAAAVDAAIKTVPGAPDVVNCYDDAAATVDTVMNTSVTEVGLSVEDAAEAALAVAPEHVTDPDQILQV